MPQKLSAMTYIKNNKSRVAVPIVSLALCFVLTYVTQFLLSTTNESIGSITMNRTQKIQNVMLSPEAFGIDQENMSFTQLAQTMADEYNDLARRLSSHEGIKKVYTAKIVIGNITPLIGSMTYEIPFVSKEDAAEIIEYMGAAVIEGRMPENECEMALDQASMLNNGYKLGDEFDSTLYGNPIKIVGVLDCDDYFGCGVQLDGTEGKVWGMITILSDIEDITAELEAEGVEVMENRDEVVDYEHGREFLRSEVTDIIGSASSYIYIGMIILLSIALVIVYTMYLRDRRNEWCLYCSIGYSRKTIYLSILRELLFTFVTALVIGGIVTAGSVIILRLIMVEPNGMKYSYFHPDTLCEILCSYMLIIGILQIPIRYSLYKIRTIDALGDDLY